MKEFKNIILYTSDDGQIKLDVSTDGETVWLSQKQMAQLFDCSTDNIGLHLKNVFDEGELKEISVSEESSVTASDGKKYKVKHYNLDAIISVGYRVNSKRGTQFRIWATQRLKEYIIKGFALDDERLKQNGGRYFDELLERIRAIRASERNFYQKITDLYTTAVDYDAQAPVTKDFFAIVQNKMHYAVSRKTAAEIISERADSKKPNMGLTSFKGKIILRPDTRIAKNYLSFDEIKELNLLVDAYLSFAELQALNKRAMTMGDWISRLDAYLKLSEKEVLQNAGKISAKAATEIADKEFDKFKAKTMKNYVSDFDNEVSKYLKQIKGKPKKK